MRIAALSVLAATICFGGCGRPAVPPSILVPGDGGRAPQIVPLEPTWLPDTLAELAKFPGCIGVDAAGTFRGKRIILAMFKDKKSAVAWYGHEAHQRLVGKVRFYRDHPHVPLKDIDDGAGPILAVATMTPAGTMEGAVPGSFLLSIELFEALPGGVQFGGATLFDPPKPAGS